MTGTPAPSWFDGILARNHQPGRYLGVRTPGPTGGSTRRSRKRTLRK